MMLTMKAGVVGILLCAMPAANAGEIRMYSPLKFPESSPKAKTTVTVFRNGKAVSMLTLPPGSLDLLAYKRKFENTKTGFLVTLIGKTKFKVGRNGKPIFEITAHGDVVKVQRVKVQ